jgi:hypothetical protein
MIMHASSQWFIAQAISSIRHGIGSRLAFEVARRAKRLVSKRRADSDFPPQGFAFTVRLSHGLAIEDAVGCEARILAGQAWITAEGAPQDTIADAGTTVPLELGVRFNISAFRDVATVLITAPRHLPDVGFSLQRRDGMRVLTITSGSSSLPARLSGSPAAIAAFARRCFAATRTATV